MPSPDDRSHLVPVQAVDPVAPAAAPERIRKSAVLAYVARPEVRARIRAAVLRKIHPSRADDVESHCYLVLLEAKPPRTEDKLEAWRATDRETLAILRAKAEKKLSYAEAAEAHGMTEAALKKRVARFVAKYEERRKRFLREEERRELLYALWLWGRALLAAAVALVIAWVALHRERPVAPVSPEPAASSAPAPATPPVNDEKNVAAPPSATPQPPAPLKPPMK